MLRKAWQWNANKWTKLLKRCYPKTGTGKLKCSKHPSQIRNSSFQPSPKTTIDPQTRKSPPKPRRGAVPAGMVWPVCVDAPLHEALSEEEPLLVR